MINYKDFSGPAEQLRRGFFHRYRRRRVPYSGGPGENPQEGSGFF